MSIMRLLVAACISLSLLGCSPMWNRDVDSLLTSGAVHSVSRIRNTAKGYGGETLAGPVDMSKDWSRRFDKAMIEVGSKDDVDYACDPTPGVSVFVHDGKVRARFLLCFECDLVIVLDDNGSVVGKMRSFKKQRETLGGLAMEAFPEDKDLAAVINQR